MEESHSCAGCGHKHCAAKVSLFKGLDEAQLENVLELVRRRRVPKGGRVFGAGDSSDSLIIVNSGRIKVYAEQEDGREQILYILEEGDFIGDLNLFKEGIHGSSASALEDTRLCSIRKRDFDDLMGRMDGLSRKMMEYAHARIEALEDLVQTLTVRSADGRLAHYILGLEEKETPRGGRPGELDLRLSREDLAAALGLTRETVSRRLSRLAEEGLIEQAAGRRLRILDRRRLEDLAEK